MTNYADPPGPAQPGAVFDLSAIPDEVLSFVSLGAYARMGGLPDESWGEHTGGPVAEDVSFADDCATCRATMWFDAAQAEMRRRA